MPADPHDPTVARDPDGHPDPMPPPPAAEPAPPAPRPRRTLLIALVAALVVVLGGGAAAAFLMMRGSSEQLVGLVPEDVDVFVTAYLDPSAGQKVNLLGLARKFPDLGEGQRLTTRVDGLVNQALTGSGLTSADVTPWLGSQIGVAVDLGDDGTPHVAALISTTDPDATLAAVEKLAADGGGSRTVDHDGVEITVPSEAGAYAIVGDVLVAGSDETTVKRTIDAAHDTLPNLGDAQIYADTLAGLPEGKLGVAYVNVEGLVEQFGSATGASAMLGASGLGDLEAIESIGMSVSAEPDGIALDLTTNFDPAKLTAEMRDILAAPDHDNTAMAFVPADALAVVATEGADTALRGTLASIEEQAPEATASIDRAGIRGFVEAMNGDVALEVGPGTDGPVSGALVVGTDDAEQMQAFLDTLGGFASQAIAEFPGGTGRAGVLPISQRAGSRPATEEYEGVTISYLDDPALAELGFAPAYAVVDGSGVVATSPEEVHQLIDTKASGEDVRSAPTYASATASVPTQESVFFLDIGPTASIVRENLPSEVQARYDEVVAPNLAPLSAFVVGSESDELHQTIRMFLQVR